MNLKNKLEILTQEFATLKDKITTKLQAKDTALQTEKDSKQEITRKLEETLKANNENEQVLTTLLTDFQELIKTLT